MNKSKKLVLNRETIRNLQESELRAVAGGEDNSWYCDTYKGDTKVSIQSSCGPGTQSNASACVTQCC
jgi:natural product precursor